MTDCVSTASFLRDGRTKVQLQDNLANTSTSLSSGAVTIENPLDFSPSDSVACVMRNRIGMIPDMFQGSELVGREVSEVTATPVSS